MCKWMVRYIVHLPGLLSFWWGIFPMINSVNKGVAFRREYGKSFTGGLHIV